MYIELKARRNHYTELLIEKSKYESLTITAMRKNYTAWYINATPLGLWAFNLTKLDKPVWKDRRMPSSTEFADKSQRIKQVGYLKLVDGIQMYFIFLEDLLTVQTLILWILLTKTCFILLTIV